MRLPFHEPITEYIIRSLNSLGERYQWVNRAQVFFKKEDGPLAKGNCCEIVISLPGAGIFASASDKNVEVAARETTLEIEKQLQKRIGVLKAGS